MAERTYWRRIRRGRVSRRALLRASVRAGVGATGLALVGCGDNEEDGPRSVTQSALQQDQQPAQRQQQPSALQRQQAAQQHDAPQQRQQEDAAEQQAQQSDRQERTDSQTQVEAQQHVTSEVARGGNLRFSTPAHSHDYFDPHRAVFGTTQYWMGFYLNNMIRWRNKEQAIMEADICSLPEIPDEETYLFRVDQGAAFWDQYPTEGVDDWSPPTTFASTSSARSMARTPPERRMARSCSKAPTPRPRRLRRPTTARSSLRPTVPTRLGWGFRSVRSAGLRRRRRSRSLAIDGETSQRTSSSPAARA